MTRGDEVPEADALEQADEVLPETETERPSIEDLPEADALEQARPVRHSGDDLPTSVGDLPEADALDQGLAAGSDDEDEERR